MCVFWGGWGFSNTIDVSKFVQGLTYLNYRGPDDEGYLLVNTSRDLTIPAKEKDTQAYFSYLPAISNQTNDFNLILGFRRLSILDLTPLVISQYRCLIFTISLTGDCPQV